MESLDHFEMDLSRNSIAHFHKTLLWLVDHQTGISVNLEPVSSYHPKSVFPFLHCTVRVVKCFNLFWRRLGEIVYIFASV